MASIKFSDIITQFDGSSDFSEWVKKLELVAELQGVKDPAKFLPLFLSKGAFAVYEGLSTAQKKDYDSIKRALTTAFSLDQCTAYEQFIRRRLLPAESVDVFLADLTRLAGLVDAHVSEDWLKCAFIAGLPDSVKQQLRAAASADNLSLTEVMVRARAMLKSNESTCANAFVSISSKPRGTVCFNCNRTGHISKNCPDKQRDADSSQRTCYKCGHVGHLSRNCQAPPESRFCFVCGDSSHVATSCPQKLTKPVSKNE